MAAGLSLGLLAGCGASEAPAPEAEAARLAKIVDVEPALNQESVSFPAIIEAAEQAEITYQVAGEVRTLSLLEGQEVSSGEVIAQLDNRDALNSLAVTPPSLGRSIFAT